MKEQIKSSPKDRLKEQLTIRDYITMALILILVYIIYSAIGIPMGLTIIGNLFMHAVCALLWGTIFMLLYTKVNKNGVPLIFGIVLALIQLINFWPLSVFLTAGGLAGEIFWQKLDKTRFRTMVLCFTLQITSWYLGILVPLILFAGSLSIISEQYTGLYMELKNFATGPMFFIGLITVIAGCVAGAFIGKLLLKKHFQKAGIV